MLPEIAAEVLSFLSRRNLDKACAVSKWLDAMIAQSCEVFPLRPVDALELYRTGKTFTLTVVIEGTTPSQTDHSFRSMRKAAQFAATILRRSYVRIFELCGMSILPDNWTTVLDAISSGAVQCFHFAGVNFSALSEDAFLIAVGRRGLQALVVRHSAISGKCVTDDLIRASAAKGLRRLIFNNNADAPPRFSEDAILDFFFRADAAQGGQWLSLELTGSGFTQMFLFKFFERLQSSSFRPSGSLAIHGGAVKQRGLAAYSGFLSSDYGTDATYRFPSVDDDNKSYKIGLYERFSCTQIEFSSS